MSASWSRPHLGLRAVSCALGCSIALALLPSRAEARRFFRARFRPATLEIQKVGELELEAELGAVYGNGPDGSRLPLPDFSIGLGVLRWLEINLDGSFVQTQLGRADSQYVGEPLWLAGRFDLYNFKDQETHATFGIGVQAGPRLPSVNNARGIGGSALGLIGGGTKSLLMVANLGSTFDREQSASLNYGVDLAYEIERRRSWKLLGEIAGAHYFRDETPNQLLFNLGVSAELGEQLELSVLVLTGPVFAGDRVGLLAGVTYDRGLW